MSEIMIHAEVAERINYVACRLGRPIISSIQIQGEHEQNMILRIRTNPEFLYEYKEKIILDRGALCLHNVKLHLQDTFYRQEMIEAREAVLHIEALDVENKDKVLAFVNIPVHLQPYWEWNRLDYGDTLCAFMQPNDLLITKIIKRAGDYAAAEGLCFDGYSGGTENVTKQASYIFRALQDEKIHYIYPPASFEKTGQKVRLPHVILKDEVKQGTCLDLAVLYATCLEAASLHSIIIMIEGHAFAGVWLDTKLGLGKYHSAGKNDSLMIYMEEKQMLPVECTFLRDDISASFEEAVDMGRENMERGITEAFDTELARKANILPVFITIGEIQKNITHLKMDSMKPDVSKLGRLLKQAMDFSMKNALLSKQTLKNELTFSIQSEPFFAGLKTEEDLNLQVQDQNQLYEFGKAEKRQQRERGYGSLYLTVNELEWGQGENQKKAPLYLCPAEIYRNIRGEYLFHIHREEMIFNPVLREFLYEEYGIDLSGMSDNPRENYKKEMEQLAFAVSKQDAWEIIEDVAGLAVYKVQNQAIYKGLQEERLLQHDIVKGILDGAMTWDNDISDACEASENQDAVYAFQADYSQREVIHSVNKKRAQVIVGPAGNGKSQTIANIITEEMRKGKHVLFVSEKLSAQEVILSMLEQVGLKAFCLSLPDGKHNAEEISHKIETILRLLAKEQGESPEIKAEESIYQEAAKKLQQYYLYMKTPGEQGYSLAELLEEYERYKGLQIPISWNASGNKLNHPEAENVVRAFAETVEICKKIDTKYLPFIKCTELTEEEGRQGQNAVQDALKALEKLQIHMETFLGYLKLNKEFSSTKEMMTCIMNYAIILGKCPVIGSELKNYIKVQATNKQEDFSSIYDKMLYSVSGKYSDSVDDIWRELEQLQEPKEDKQLDEFSELDRLSGTIQKDGYTLAQRRNLLKVGRYLDYQKKLKEKLSERLEEEQKAILEATVKIGCGAGKDLQMEIQNLKKLYQIYTEYQKKASALIVCDMEGFEQLYPEDTKDVLFREWERNRSYQKELQLYERAINQGREIGIGILLHQMENKILQNKMSADEILPLFRKCRCEYNISYMQKEQPYMQEFAQIDYKVCLKQYQEQEKCLREQLRQQLPKEVISHMPHMEEGVSESKELGYLQKLIRRNGSNNGIRSIFQEAPHMLQQLFPCMLMGPASVAEYLPTEQVEFDIVIFDEASQLPTYKALIPVSMSRRCLFIGDEKQLTPTSFFQKNMEDEDGTETPAEAILEDAVITSMPQKMLCCHYRSKDESLVAFSNSRYYNGEIVTFPGPAVEISGVHYLYVEEGCYDRGGNRNNVNEAKCVLTLIQEIYAGLSADTEETLGVITFNQEQKKLIDTLLCEKIEENTAQSRVLAEFVDVVNLESCQGKEWDRTILSTAYGKDAEGNFSANLGPVTRADGGNRLNVMITRARKEMYVVTSMKPEMFDTETGGGNQDIRDFLAFARGDLRLDTRETGVGKTSSVLTKAVAEALFKRGYTVHTNIGSSSCKVDVGVVGKDGKTYQLGILTDHFNNSHYYVRDEEVIIPAILEQKGWKLYRLHAVNWYEDAEFEMRQIEKLLEK